MKTKLIFSVFLLCSSIMSLFSSSNFSTNLYTNKYDAEKQIELAGSLEMIPLRSGGNPFDVTLSSYLINITYLNDLNNITIKIFDETGAIVYQNNVNPVSGEQLLINITNWTEGYYSISFSNDTGGSITGEFEILH